MFSKRGKHFLYENRDIEHLYTIPELSNVRVKKKLPDQCKVYPHLRNLESALSYHRGTLISSQTKGF